MNCVFIPDSIDLEVTIDSAQSFRWKRTANGTYAGTIASVPLLAAQSGEGLTVYGDALDVSAIRRYFDLDRNYEALLLKYEDEPMVGARIGVCKGLRVLNQPVWETLVAFLFSQHNNVARITLLMDRLCREAGRKVRVREFDVFTVPEPEDILRFGEEGLRRIGAGYRAPYVLRAAQAVADGFDLDSLAHMPYDSALVKLMTLHGVGEKVADCVLLFGCGHACAFPVDRWIARVLAEHFPDEKNVRRLKRLAVERLGEHAGIANQFMFHCARKGMIIGGEGAG